MGTARSSVISEVSSQFHESFSSKFIEKKIKDPYKSSYSVTLYTQQEHMEWSIKYVTGIKRWVIFERTKKWEAVRLQTKGSLWGGREWARRVEGETWPPSLSRLPTVGFGPGPSRREI